MHQWCNANRDSVQPFEQFVSKILAFAFADTSNLLDSAYDRKFAVSQTAYSRMQTFSVTTLGCKVNQYESDQIATLLRARGLRQVPAGGDLRVINTCSVTIQAASKSRQMARRAARVESSGAAHRVSLPVLSASAIDAKDTQEA